MSLSYEVTAPVFIYFCHYFVHGHTRPYTAIHVIHGYTRPYTAIHVLLHFFWFNLEHFLNMIPRQQKEEEEQQQQKQKQQSLF